ncbi:hypothetical protein [Shewanella sp. 6_MG-2023]|uniref:hypothetical protein n=1 Tax=Shewanella sp. 6_MG-2023 TaxID=3062660 RepID=UPI0026E27F82|nr:hypothetical protein [Shewanella sp. 6_MG-2023]MDO6617633.1 hypothetical protein [Shewanella sp. 6_MG-2023]
MKFSVISLFCCSFYSVSICANIGEIATDMDKVRLLADVNQDGVVDWASYNDAMGAPKFEVFSGQDGSFLKSFLFPSHFIEDSFHWVSDRTGDGVNDVGLFGFNPTLNKYQFILKNSATGDTISTWSWNNNVSDAVFNELEDLTLDNISDFAILGIHRANGTVQLQVRDGSSRSQVATFKWPNNYVEPRVVSMSDVTGDNISEVALYGQNKRLTNGQLFAYDGNNPSNKIDVYNWVKNWDEINLIPLQDLDSDGTLDWGQFGQRRDDKRYQLVIKKGSSKLGTIRTHSWSTKILSGELLTLSDITGDGFDEVAVTGYDYTDGKFKVLINDGNGPNERLKNISWPNKWLPGSKVIKLHDIDGDGINEIGLLGTDSNSLITKLSIKSIVTGQQLLSYQWSGVWADFHIESYDANNDGVLDIGLAGLVGYTQLSRIVVKDGTDSNLTLIDKTLDSPLVSLDSFLSATSDQDYRFFTSFNSAYRATDSVSELFFDGKNVHSDDVVMPYTIEGNSLTLEHSSANHEIHNFLYVNSNIGVSLVDTGELALFSKLTTASDVTTEIWTKSDFVGKNLHFLMDDAGSNSTDIVPFMFDIFFWPNEAEINLDDETIDVPWHVNDSGQLVISLSEVTGDKDMIINHFSSDDKVQIVIDSNRNNSPLMMSVDPLIIYNIGLKWYNAQ